ncbi:hypothetical protein Hanom_Chr15g01371011 [Helianthus anomalus]
MTETNKHIKKRIQDSLIFCFSFHNLSGCLFTKTNTYKNKIKDLKTGPENLEVCD